MERFGEKFDRASIMRWHENCALSHESFGDFEMAMWHRWCADQIIERKDELPESSFAHHRMKQSRIEADGTH